jgi:NAD(P)H-flavin reductase
MYRIVSKKALNAVVEEMVVHAPFVARRCEPGQFIILRVSEDGERVPLTIADYDRAAETVTIIYQVVGETTRILSRYVPGDAIPDFVGPLGRPSGLPSSGRVIGIGGGVGAAPLFPQMRWMAEQGVSCDVILGGRNAELILLEDRFAAFCENVYCTTDDGSRGLKGLVTQQLQALLEKGEKYDEVIAIGPLVMMKFVAQLTKQWDLKTAVSLNPIMVDGTGMCGGCRVTVGGETKFACVDGPDFDGHAVDFDELARRQTMYRDEEAHSCKLGLEK